MRVTISQRRFQTLLAAENVARAFRTYMGTPNYKTEKRQQAIDAAVDWTRYWMEHAPRGTKYEMPPDVPKRWKYNRDQAAKGWPDKRESAKR